jgi:hypothetical protein
MQVRSYLKLGSIAVALVLFVAFASQNASSATMEPRALFEKRCSRCHSVDKIPAMKSAGDWKATVEKMSKKFFSGISDGDAKIITDYLVQTRVAPESSAGQGTPVPAAK